MIINALPESLMNIRQVGPKGLRMRIVMEAIRLLITPTVYEPPMKPDAAPSIDFDDDKLPSWHILQVGAQLDDNEDRLCKGVDRGVAADAFMALQLFVVPVALLGINEVQLRN